MRNLAIGILALSGFVICGLVIHEGRKKPVYSESAKFYPISPYKSFIAGQGIIESVYKNIPIGASYSDIITDVYVSVGDVVKKGTVLFKTDTRHFEAQRHEALKDQAVAQEDYLNQSTQFTYYENLSDKSAVSKQAYTNAEYNKKLAFERLEKSKAAVKLVDADIERSLVRAPIDGEILQLNIRVGQYAYQAAMNDLPLILFGDTEYLHLRVDIDEEDSWRYERNSPATGYVRGNGKIEMPLEYVYIEPYIIPKKSLTGSDVERVDTRVLQVVYRFKKNNAPVYLGQLLDVYIQAKQSEVS